MGRVIVTCLSRQDRLTKITVADRREPSAALPAQARFVRADLMNHAALVRVLRGHAVVINSTWHHFNLSVMRAALAAGVDYLDLGGLFHFTRRQLKLDAAFRAQGLRAVLGMGCAPGIANLLAKWAAEDMERVEEIHIKLGGRSWGVPVNVIPYAAGTIREELLWKPAIYHAGRLRFEKPGSGAEWFQFPSPVGRQRIFRTIHSEMATLPRNFTGVREASFKIGFPDEMIRAVLHPQPAQGRVVAAATREKSVRDCEITVALVRSRRGGQRIARMAACAAASAEGRLAGDWDTAWPPAIVARMLARGEIAGSGVFAPERVVPLEPFLARLRGVGFRLTRRWL